ncbi:MAG: AAA family ATPase [Clostridia bacterium]|nr:AAA family ATPase [Clostridia bacterium]
MGILICGLNGVGKSSIGIILAERLSYRFIDDEDLYFSKQDKSYKFSNPRSKAEVEHILETMIAENNNFVFSAVKGDYGDTLISALDYAILIEVPKQIRIQRVRERSFVEFGERILPGGDLFEKENAWFSFVERRAEDYVSKWIEQLNCPVIRLDGTLPIEENVNYLISTVS